MNDRSAGWSLELGLIQSGRSDVASFRHPSGASLSIWYDQGVLKGDKRKELVKHIMGHASKQRPDLTVRAVTAGGREMWTVVEIKQSQRRETLVQGINEALLYVHEYAPALTTPPRAVLVAEGGIHGSFDLGNIVAATSWSEWVPPALLKALTADLQP